MNTTPTPTVIAGPIARATLLVGPLASCLLLQRYALQPFVTSVAATAFLAVMLFWLPFGFFTAPAILAQDVRDAFEPHRRGLGRVVRAFRMVPWLFSRSCPARTENLLSVVGCAIALSWAYRVVGFDALGTELRTYLELLIAPF